MAIETAALDAPLHALGFQFDQLTPEKVSGRLRITDVCCQPFKKLHGGVSALIAESLASLGAQLPDFKRVAGAQLNVNHLKSAELGDTVVAEATPINKGLRIQVWSVKLWKIDPSAELELEVNRRRWVLISSSTVTLVNNLPVPEHANHASDGLKKYAKL